MHAQNLQVWGGPEVSVLHTQDVTLRGAEVWDTWKNLCQERDREGRGKM